MKKDIITYHRWFDSHRRSWHDPMQHAISAKIDNKTFEMAEEECRVSGVKRNRLINLALKWYIQELGEAREKRVLENIDDKYILKIDMADLTGEELDALQHICRGFGCNQDVLVRHLIRIMIQDYDKNPYRYMP